MCVCVSIYVCYEHLCACACVCAGQRSGLCYTPSYSVRQGLSLKLELTALAKGLASTLRDVLVSISPVPGFTGTCLLHTWLSTWVLGIQTRVLVLQQQALYHGAASPPRCRVFNKFFLNKFKKFSVYSKLLL